MNEFMLQRPEVVSYKGVISVVIAPNHAAQNAVLRQGLMEPMAGVLAALVEVVEEPRPDKTFGYMPH